MIAASHDQKGVTHHRVPGRPDWEIVGLLWGAFFLNQADRQVFNVVMPLIRQDLGLTDTELGLVATTFTLVYSVFVIIGGVLGDVFNRRMVVVASLLLFTCGTLLTGFASSLVLLLIFRGVATGVGEATYAPAAFSLIGETHVETRARAIAIHQTANYTGIVLGSLAAGWIGQTYGWRSAFYFYGLLGIVWTAIFLWRTRNRPSSKVPKVDIGHHLALIRRSAKLVGATPVLLAQIFAFAGLVFSYVGFLTWMPTLLVERFGVSIATAGFSSVFYHLLLSYVAVLAASAFTDRMVRRWPRVRLVSMSLGLILCAPFLWLIPRLDSLTMIYVVLGCYGLVRGTYDAGLVPGVFDEVDDDLRSTVISLLLGGGFLIGAGSPLILGALKMDYGLGVGFGLLAAAAFITGITLLVTAFLSGPRASRPKQARRPSYDLARTERP